MGHDCRLIRATEALRSSIYTLSDHVALLIIICRGRNLSHWHGGYPVRRSLLPKARPRRRSMPLVTTICTLEAVSHPQLLRGL